jgi:hypothetical protein
MKKTETHNMQKAKFVKTKPMNCGFNLLLQSMDIIPSPI